MENYFSKSSRHTRLLVEQGGTPISPVPITWTVLKNPERLSKKFTFKNTESRNFFITELLEYEATNHHHAAIQIDELAVIINVHTKDMSSVTELDFEYKKQTDLIFKDSAEYEKDDDVL